MRIQMKQYGRLLWAASFILTISMSACSYRKIVISDVVDMAETAMQHFENNYQSLDLMEKSAPANLVNLEVLLLEDPENERLLVLLSKLYFSYAHAFLEDKWDIAALGGDSTSVSDLDTLGKKIAVYYAKGAGFALRALSLRYPDCAGRISTVGEMKPFMNQLDEADVPALFWLAANKAAYLNIDKSSVQAMSSLYMATKALERIVELDENYYYGCAHLNLMVIYGGVPAMQGGNMAKAMAHYRRHKEIWGDGFLLREFYFARYVLYQQQERDEYDRKLRSILDYPVDGKPYELLNRVAQRRAGAYLKVEEILFE